MWQWAFNGSNTNVRDVVETGVDDDPLGVGLFLLLLFLDLEIFIHFLLSLFVVEIVFRKLPFAVFVLLTEFT